ncbi:MAG: hypothetical protein OEY93_02620 [Anaerolineae bacterium]|nr:hypothetical protein [Anaerolineae bacterium]
MNWAKVYLFLVLSLVSLNIQKEDKLKITTIMISCTYSNPNLENFPIAGFYPLPSPGVDKPRPCNSHLYTTHRPLPAVCCPLPAAKHRHLDPVAFGGVDGFIVSGIGVAHNPHTLIGKVGSSFPFVLTDIDTVINAVLFDSDTVMKHLNTRFYNVQLTR